MSDTNKQDWDPRLYLKFNKERIQPSIDLVSRINFEQPGRIIDIGCGPGNSTRILTERWPRAEVTGADNSPAMIKKASEDYPDQKWILFDACKDKADGKFDIVFSNATIQWLPDHNKLIQRFSEMLTDKGCLAIQLPLFSDMPLGKAISEASRSERWHSLMAGVDNLFIIHTPSYYFDQLSRYFSSSEIWVTDYFHVMDSQMSILEMIRSTGLKPYLERISGKNEKEQFENEIFQSITRDYPLQENGRVLFPFKRLFFVAIK
jgi:trans-aconitate 2-methyltransferase